jgi:hypothetical protein
VSETEFRAALLELEERIAKLERRLAATRRWFWIALAISNLRASPSPSLSRCTWRTISGNCARERGKVISIR